MNDLLSKDISDLIGLESLPPDQQAAFLGQIGDTVMESALLRLIADLNEEQQAALDHYLETEPEPEAMMQHLLTHYPHFETFVEEEVTALKSEIIAVMDTEESDNTTPAEVQ